MIVGFGNRGLDGPHQSNTVRKSRSPVALRDPPAMSTDKTTHKELGGVKGRSRQEDKSVHKRSDQVIVEFPRERRMSTMDATSCPKKQSERRQSMPRQLSKSLVDVTEKQSDRRQSMPKRLSKSLMDANSCPEKQSEQLQIMPRISKTAADAPDWMKTSRIDWGEEDEDTNFEGNVVSDQSDVTSTLPQNNKSDLTESMTSLNASIRSLLSIRKIRP
jgi:hypothetical protein